MFQHSNQCTLKLTRRSFERETPNATILLAMPIAVALYKDFFRGKKVLPCQQLISFMRQKLFTHFNALTLIHAGFYEL
jgi:hypothetical protein